MSKYSSLNEVIAKKKFIKLKPKIYNQSFTICGKGKDDVYTITGDSFRSTILKINKPIVVKNCKLVLNNIRIVGNNTTLFKIKNADVNFLNCVRLTGNYDKGEKVNMLELCDSSIVYNYCKMLIRLKNVKNFCVVHNKESEYYNVFSLYQIIAYTDIDKVAIVKGDGVSAINYTPILFACEDSGKFKNLLLGDLSDDAIFKLSFVTIGRMLKFALNGDNFALVNRKEGTYIGMIDNFLKENFKNDSIEFPI